MTARERRLIRNTCQFVVGRLLEIRVDAGYGSVADVDAMIGMIFENVAKLPADAKFEADVIDPWAMTVARSQGTYSGRFELKMPGRPGLAVRFRRAA